MYPQGTASADFASSIYTSSFSPAQVCGGVIDGHTPVSNVGMKNSLGYQLALTQNFVNQMYLGRDQYRIKEGWIDKLYVSGIVMDSTDETLSLYSSGILRFFCPEAETAAMYISGNYIGINKGDPEYEMDIYGTFRCGYSNYGGIRIYGDNGFYNYIAADSDSEQELFLQTSTQDAGFVHINPQIYGGVSLNDQQHATNDGDLFYADNITYTSGLIMWSDCDISGFDSYT